MLDVKSMGCKGITIMITIFSILLHMYMIHNLDFILKYQCPLLSSLSLCLFSLIFYNVVILSLSLNLHL